eukprot:1155928-Prymnesium_polylepis.1
MGCHEVAVLSQHALHVVQLLLAHCFLVIFLAIHVLVDAVAQARFPLQKAEEFLPLKEHEV